MIAVLTVSAVAIGGAAGGRVGGGDRGLGPEPDLAAARATPIRPTEIYASDGTPARLRPRRHDFDVRRARTRSPRASRRRRSRSRTGASTSTARSTTRASCAPASRTCSDRATTLQGASTLTQQLVNTVYLPKKYHAHRDLKYKIIQAKLAEQLEAKHSKSWILGAYLNNVSYGTTNGEEAVGVGAAALMFFDKPVSKINLAQMSLLAGLPQSPTTSTTRRSTPSWPSSGATRSSRRWSSRATSSPGLGHRGDEAAAPAPSQRAVHRAQPAVHLRLHPAAARPEVRREHGRARRAQGLHDDQPEAAAGGRGRDPRPRRRRRTRRAARCRRSRRSTRPTGNILAIASSATYDQTKFDFPVQAERQTGSAFKVFALMTLIHDYDGDPNDTYYTSKFLPVGWNPLDPTWSVHTAEETYQGVINITKATTVSDNTVFAQLADDEGYGKLDATAHAMGITSPLDGFPSEVIGGLKYCCTMLEMADAYATLANGGTHVPATILSKVVFPNGKVVNLGDPPHTRVFSDGEAYEGTQVLKTVIQERHRDRRQLRLPGRRQDRHGGELGQRLVRRLHAQAVDRGLGRLPAGQHPDGFVRLRRDAGRADLARLHGARLARLLRRLPEPDHALHRHRVHRPALVGQESPPPKTQPGRPDRAPQQPEAVRPADQRRPARRRPDRWRDRPRRQGTGGGGAQRRLATVAATVSDHGWRQAARQPLAGRPARRGRLASARALRLDPALERRTALDARDHGVAHVIGGVMPAVPQVLGVDHGLLVLGQRDLDLALAVELGRSGRPARSRRSSVSSSHTRTTQPWFSGLPWLLLSRCRPQRHSRIVLAVIRSSWTRPKRAPIDSTHLTIDGHFSAFEVQTPSRSALPYSQKPLSSISPVAEVIGAKYVVGSLE